MNWFSFNSGDFAVAFLSVLLEGIPFLLLGSLISGVVDAFVSPERLSRILPRNPIAAVVMSAGLGLLFPMCECGSVVVIRRFLRKGLPVGCAVSYMLGAPIVSPIVALSTYAAFRGQHPLEMTCLRLGLGFLIAVIVGLILQQIPAQSIMQTGITPEAVPAQGRGGLRVASFSEAQQSLESSLGSCLQKAIYSAATDFLDVAVFFIIGAAITSLLGTAVQRSVLEPLASNPLLAIISLMLMAIALALCSTTDAFIAATSFPSFPMAAKLAFLVFGAMFDLKLYWLYGLIFKRKVVILLGLSLFIGIALICWRLNTLGF
ncbi:MAG: permease [Verrucomicrobiota bacterium]